MPVLADDDVVMHGDAEWGAMSLMAFVIWMSACDGIGSPEGGLCTRIIVKCRRHRTASIPTTYLATQKNRGGVQWLIGFALRGVGKRGSARSKAKRLQCTAATCSQLRSRPARR